MPNGIFTLISHPLYPFVQRAAIVIREKKVPFESIDVNLADKPGWFMTISPAYKVPLSGVNLTDRADMLLFERPAICEYLNEAQKEASLYSNDAVTCGQSRTWLEFGVAGLYDVWLFLHAKDSSSAIDKQAAFRENLQRLDTTLG